MGRFIPFSVNAICILQVQGFIFWLFRKRKERRRTSIFSISSFDPDDASFCISENDIEEDETNCDPEVACF